MRTVTENTALLSTSFDVKDVPIVGKAKKCNTKRSCFYEFGIDNNEFLEKLWEDQDDSIVADINAFFT